MKKLRLLPMSHLGRRRQILVLFAGWTMLGCSSAWAQAETGNATINVTGSILGPTCSLTTSDITIDIGTVESLSFTGVGSFSAWAPNETLVSGGCDAALVSMTFTGTADPNNATLFEVTGGAAGVGIQLQKDNVGDSSGQAIPNSSQPITFAPAAVGEGYAFSARYVQTEATVRPGPANATITVLITYT